MADLNKILDYDLIGKQPPISAAAQAKIDCHVIVDKDDWGDSFSKDFISINDNELVPKISLTKFTNLFFLSLNI